MVETRANPISGSMEILHPDLNLWVQAIAPLLVAGGWTVALDDIERTMLSNLKDNSDELPDILSQLQDIKAAIDSADNTLQAINIQTLSQTNSDLDTIIQDLTSVLQGISILTGTLNGSATINSLVQQIATNTIDYSQAIAALHQDLGTINTLLTQQLAAISAKLDPVALTPTIANLTLVTANTQYSYTLPAGTRKYAFKCRNDSSKPDPVGDLRYSWMANKVAPSSGSGAGIDTYDVLPSNAEESSNDYFSVDRTIYFASSVAGVVLTIRRWS